MVSDSGASSYPTPNGRPSMWNRSGERKLARLYTYTNLPVPKIIAVLDALHVSNTNECPGKDSVNKRLNHNLDKQPRWLRPRDRDDMERRMQELSLSPARNAPPKNPLNRQHFASSIAGAAAADFGSRSAEHLVANGLETRNAAPINRRPTSVYDFSSLIPTEQIPTTLPSRWNPPLNLTPIDTTHNTVYPTTPTPYTQISSASPLDVGPSEPPTATAAGLASPFIPTRPHRQSTTATTSTELSTTTIRQALSEYSSGFVKHVSRIVKRHTLTISPMPAIDRDDSAFDSRPGSPNSSRDSFWTCEDNDDDNVSFTINNSRPLPGDFLRLDIHLRERAPCYWAEHDSGCYCAAVKELTSDHWVTTEGLAPDLVGVLRGEEAARTADGGCDPYGHTLLHLLAARDAPHCHLHQAIRAADNPLTVNSADQTFLHLLGDSWFAAPHEQAVAPVLGLLRWLSDQGLDIYARDIYGRSVFHLIESKIEDPRHIMDILRHFPAENFRYRDAFGNVPGDQEPQFGVRRSRTDTLEHVPSFWEPPRQFPPATTFVSPDSSDAGMRKHAQLLHSVRQALEVANHEDSKGRNGLHCLAETILSSDTLIAKYAQPFPTSAASLRASASVNGRKRKHSTPHLDKNMCDSSKGRLTLREELVANLLHGGVDPNHYSLDGTTPLMAFVEHLPEDGDYHVPVAILQLLINAGADVNARNRQGETALHIAVRCGRKLAVRTLKQNGANIHARDGAGQGLLEIADAKLARSEKDPKAYSHYEACRAWLSGKEAKGVQSPTLAEEWEPREDM